MSVYANEGVYALAGFAKVVIAIDGSVVPIITSTNASVHPPPETVDMELVSGSQCIHIGSTNYIV